MMYLFTLIYDVLVYSQIIHSTNPNPNPNPNPNIRITKQTNPNPNPIDVWVRKSPPLAGYVHEG